MAKKKRGGVKRKTAKKKRGKTRRITIDLSNWKSINFHPKTGANLKGLGYAMHAKTGQVRHFHS